MRVLPLIIMLLTANCVCAQTEKKMVFSTPGWGPTQWNWATEKWDGNEKKYRDMRLAIDQKIKQGANPVELARQYQKQARSWTDAPGQYRWAYAAYKAAEARGFPEKDETLKGISMEDIRQALDKAADEETSSRNYEYARLRFLSFARVWPESRLTPMGERLLKRNPKDFEVRFQQLRLLAPGVREGERAEALSHVNWVFKNMPNDPIGHYLLGSVYSRIRMSTWSQADADKAIAAYQKFLQIAPSNEKYRPYRQKAEKEISFIRRMQEHWAKHPEIVAKHKQGMAEREARRQKQNR